MTNTTKILIGVGVAILGYQLYKQATKPKGLEKKSNFDDVFDNADGEDFYDFDSDYDFSGPEDFDNVEGEDDDFYNAKGKGVGKKRQLRKWQRRVKILTKKINLAKKGLIKAQNKVAKWEGKLTDAQNKVAELSK